jgi:hypothetical protein
MYMHCTASFGMIFINSKQNASLIAGTRTMQVHMYRTLACDTTIKIIVMFAIHTQEVMGITGIKRLPLDAIFD